MRLEVAADSFLVAAAGGFRGFFGALGPDLAAHLRPRLLKVRFLSAVSYPRPSRATLLHFLLMLSDLLTPCFFMAVGLFASGYPNITGPDVSFLGQLAGAAVMIALGFIPGYGVSLALKKLGGLRIPEEVEAVGMDLGEIPASAYPEGIPATLSDWEEVNGNGGTPVGSRRE